MHYKTVWIFLGSLLWLSNLNGQTGDVVLSVQQNTSGYVELRWSSCSGPDMQTVLIYRAIAEETESLIRTMSLPSGSVICYDTLWICSSPVHYRIETSTPSGCQQQSNIVSIDFTDKIVPRAVDLASVSVDPMTDHVSLYWPASNTPDAYGYFIFTGTSATLFDTVYGVENQSYQHQILRDTTLFRISVFDSCYNRSLLSSARHIFKAQLHQNICDQRIQVSWDSVISAIDPKAIEGFEVWYAIDQAPFVLSGTYGSEQRQAFIENVRHQDHYRVFVRVVHQLGLWEVNSLSDTLVVISAPEPRWVHIESLSFLDEQTIQMECDVDMTYVWQSSYLLGHSANTKVDTLHRYTYSDFQKDSLWRFIDTHPLYSLMLRDTCGAQAGHSMILSPYRLEGEINEQYVGLTWDPEVLWYPAVDRLELLRLLDGDTTYLSLASVDQSSFQENLNLTLKPMRLAYILRAYPSRPEGLKEPYAQSQPLVLISEDRVQIQCPSAFKRGGSPFKSFYKTQPGDRFMMQVWDRFGALMFETRDPEIGWDGRHKGRDAHVGVYVYVIRLYRGEILNEFSGTVTLID